MNLLPLFTSTFNIADTFTKSLSAPVHHRFVSLIGADPTVEPLALATATAVAPTVAPAPVDTPAVVASPTVVDTAVPASDSVPSLHPNLPLRLSASGYLRR